MVAHQVAHEANEREIVRVAKGIAELEDAVIFLFIEIFKVVQPAAGEKGFIGAAGIFPFHGLVEKRLELPAFGRRKVSAAHLVNGSRAAAAALLQLLRIQDRQFFVQLGDQFRDNGLTCAASLCCRVRV